MRTLLLLPLAVLALAACGGGNEEVEPQPTQPPATAGIAMGPGISIEEAIASDLEGPLLVNGNLLAEGDEVRLCDALAESFPPQCAGPQLRVEGLKLDEVDGLVREGEVAWTDRPIQLLGDVEGDTLVVSTTSMG
ncbi:MAG: hypothetical protein WD027_06810 [Gaiellales bacterium]